MKKKDIVAIVVLSEITAVFLSFVFKNLELKPPFPVLLLLIIVPALALIANAVFYFIGKRIPIFYQLARFLTVGFANTAVDFGILNLLMLISLTSKNEILALFNVISFLIAATHSYFWNKLWTFQIKEKTKAFSQFSQFVVISFVGVLINSGIIYFVIEWAGQEMGKQVWVNIAKVFATIISLMWNFVGYKFIVFKKKNGEQLGNLS